MQVENRHATGEHGRVYLCVNGRALLMTALINYQSVIHGTSDMFLGKVDE
jgi:hypothetical protein